jgi:hypothetical protein
MEWENIPEDVSKWFGFVYVIERLNAENGEKRFYWGCKWQLKFEELKTQMENNAIAREDSYNGIINVRLTKVPIGLKEHYNS